MLHNLKKLANRTYTENGALTYRSTLSECLDLFATVGALRGQTMQEIESRFLRAFAENKDLAMKLLFYARDIRGGLGERRVFRILLRWLAKNEPASLRKNLQYIAEYGRYDDLFVLFGTPLEKEMLSYISACLQQDLAALENGGAVSLLGKWMPSVNTSDPQTVQQAKRLARHLKMSDKEYRQMLSRLRAQIRILENNLRTKDYSFDYSKQPSKAMHKYRKAFIRNDGERYESFLRNVASGHQVLHTGTLTPYEVVAPFFHSNVSDEERRAIDVTWNALDDFTNGENALAVIDGSGSMYDSFYDPMPANVALSLGVYFAERNKGAFANHFITFSEHPRLVEIKGGDILDRLRYCHNFNEVANTNLQRVFELVLKAAVRGNLPQEEMPKTLYIISDMEFDHCAMGAAETNFAYAKRIFAQAGYALPQVVFWNVASRNRQQPVQKNEQGVALVSGCSPRIFSMALRGDLSPEAFMLEVLQSERYERIAA